jgi:hypothetical protein
LRPAITTRHRLGAPGGGASFAPHSYYCFLPAGPDAERIGAEQDGHSELAASPDARHETIHWLQAFGTTAGIFLAHVREMQALTFHLQFDILPSDIKEKLTKERLEPPYRPFLPIAPDGGLRAIDRIEHRAFEWFAHIWYDFLLVEHLFSRYERQSGLIYSTEGPTKDRVFAEVSTDLLVYNHSKFRHIEREAQALCEWYVPADGQGNLLDWAFHDPNDLPTTDDLMECAASLDEILHLDRLGPRNSRRLHEMYAQIGISLSHSRYGKPTRVLARTYPGLAENIREYIPTTMALCDTALNPPLAPVVHPGIKLPNGWNRWENLSPPLRFARMAGCVGRLGLLPRDADRSKLLNYVDDLCALSGITNPSTYMQQDLDEGGFLEAVETFKTTGNYGGLGTRVTFAKSLARRMLKIREVTPGFFVLPSDYRHWPIFFPDEKDFNETEIFYYGLCRQAPLWGMGDRAFRLGMNSTKMGWMAGHAILNHIVHELMCGSGQITFDGLLPREAWPIAMLMVERGAFNDFYGVDPGKLKNLLVTE